jgi:hypothetical protein
VYSSNPSNAKKNLSLFLEASQFGPNEVGEIWKLPSPRGLESPSVERGKTERVSFPPYYLAVEENSEKRKVVIGCSSHLCIWVEAVNRGAIVGRGRGPH